MKYCYIPLLCLTLAACTIQPAIDDTNNVVTPKVEADYVALVCPRLGGVQEHRTSVGARVDCLTETQAIEFDWVHKWYEGITQALYYAMLTERQAAVALIEKGQNSQRYVAQARTLVEFYDLPVAVMLVSADADEMQTVPIRWP